MAEEDLLFGKNRHLFGGIAPSKMQKFAVETTELGIKISAILPVDTVINGQTLCIVSGALIVRNDKRYPKDEFDGTVIADITQSMDFVDQTATPAKTYYYAAFPYSEQGVFNRDMSARGGANEPSAMKTFRAMLKYREPGHTPYVEIKADFPADIVSVVIRRGTEGFPETETDGTPFQTITSSGTYEDNEVVDGLSYFYTAFPANAEGDVNRDITKNRASIFDKTGYFMGFKLVPGDKNSSARVTYPEGVDNFGFKPAKMDFKTKKFNYGDWKMNPGEKFMPKPCMLRYDGTVAYYLWQDDYAFRADGEDCTKKDPNGTPSDISDPNFEGNAMMEWPKIYWRYWTEGKVEQFRVSNRKIDDSYECWSNYDKNDNEIEHFYTPIYYGSEHSGKLRSLSGKTNSVSKNATQEISLCQANGADIWFTEVFADRKLIESLLVMMGKSTNSQETFGYGVCSASAAINSGSMNKNGLFWGSDDQKSGVKVFGMEHFWGNMWRRIAGWIMVNGTQRVKMTRGVYDGSTAEDYNTTGDGYIAIPGSTPSGTNGGYISEMVFSKYGRLPKVATGGSATTYEADGLWFNNSGAIYAFVGGNWDNALLAGLFSSYLHDAPSAASAAIGAALSCKPLAQ